MHLPVTEGAWLRPSPNVPAEPRWGHPEGLQVGLHPLGGPRGLLRIYAPYLDHPRDRLINFIAVEPIPEGSTKRGLSELEHSTLDDVPGKRFWSADDPSGATPQAADHPAQGVIETIDGVERLRVYVLVEPFDNGADVYLRLSFRADRPHEVSVATYQRDESASVASCIVSATMGNFARLRQLHLSDGVVTPAELWPDFSGDHFAPHAQFPLSRLTRTDTGAALVRATPDETDPWHADYADDTHEHWKYVGLRATQTWQVEDPDSELVASVNARHAYWASTSPIPGGASYENFELVEPFLQGREFTFAVDPLD